MKGFLKNYTSDVAVSITIGRIEAVLIKCGVMGITKEYGAIGEVIALRFQIPMETKVHDVRLPADTKKAQHALWIDYIGDDLTAEGKIIWGSRKHKREKDFLQQGERTAWRLMQDWIEVQMSMITLDQAKPMQVFMAYIWDGQATVYDRMIGNGFKALLPENTQA